MKRIFLIVLMALSLQLFSEDYKVVLKKGVTLSQQEINSNNKEIEEPSKEITAFLQRQHLKEGKQWFPE